MKSRFENLTLDKFQNENLRLKEIVGGDNCHGFDLPGQTLLVSRISSWHETLCDDHDYVSDSLKTP